jgi:hypothetical protein
MPPAHSPESVRTLGRPAAQAARCFARNAEAHSSALVSEVSAVDRDRFEVIVRVKNGATYASAVITPAGRGSSATILLNTRPSQGTAEVIDALVEGC